MRLDGPTTTGAYTLLRVKLLLPLPRRARLEESDN
jgi:hypothetical protein